MAAHIKTVAAAYPDIVRVFSIGKSYEGRKLWAAEVSDNLGLDEGEPEILFDGLHHAREHLSAEMAIDVLDLLTSRYGARQRVSRLVNERRTWIVFMVNPDGLEHDLTGDPYRDWRKNREPSPGTGRHRHGPQSELRLPIRMLRGLVSEPGQRLVSRAAGLVGARGAGHARLRPEPRRGRPAAHPRAHLLPHRGRDGPLAIRVHARRCAARHDAARCAGLPGPRAGHGGHERVCRHAVLPMYVTDGDMIDWMYGKQRIFSFTFELYPRGGGDSGRHYPPDEVIGRETRRNRDAVLYLMAKAACPWSALGREAARAHCGPFFDDLEIDRGWRVDAGGHGPGQPGALVAG